MNGRIKELRKKLDMTLEEFGKRLGVTKSAMSNIENGNRNVTEQIFLSICREFNVNENWLRTGCGEMFIQMSKKAALYNHFGYMMENSTPQKKAVLSTLIEMIYYLPDDKWDYIFDQFNECLTEARSEKAEHDVSVTDY